MLILLLAVSAWALYVGIDSTKSVVSNFWGIVDQIQIKVRQRSLLDLARREVVSSVLSAVPPDATYVYFV